MKRLFFLLCLISSTVFATIPEGYVRAYFNDLAISEVESMIVKVQLNSKIDRGDYWLNIGNCELKLKNTTFSRLEYYKWKRN